MKRYINRLVVKFIVSYLQRVNKDIPLRIFHHGVLKESIRHGDIPTINMEYDTNLDGVRYKIKSTFNIEKYESDNN